MNSYSKLMDTPWISPEFEPGLVSVIIPTYNRAHLIAETLNCLEKQAWAPVEVVVVDDGSTDDTLEIVEQWLRVRTDANLRVISQANAGVAAARNTGTRAARGEFIVYLDSDDILFPDAIQNYVECLVACDVEYCFAPIDCIDENGRPSSDSRKYYPKVNSPDYLLDCFWLIHGACYRRQVVNSAGPWRSNLVGEDYEFIWRIKASAGRGHYLDAVQGTYRQHSQSQLHNRVPSDELYVHKRRALDLFTEWLGQRGMVDRALCLRLANKYRFIAVRLALDLQMREKNLALKAMQRLYLRARSPLYFRGVLRLINVPWFYRLISLFRYHRSRRKRRELVDKTISSNQTPSLLFVSPLFPDAEGSGTARRAEKMVRALSQSYEVSLLVVSSYLHASSKPVEPDYLAGRWVHVPFEESGWWRFHRKLERRLPWLYKISGKLPPDFLHDPERIAKARMAFVGQQFEVVHGFRLAVADCALHLRKTQPANTKFHLDIDDIESIGCESLARLMRVNGETEKANELETQSQAYARAERKLYACFDRLYVSSKKDRDRLLGGHPDVRLLPNVVNPPPAFNEFEMRLPEDAARPFRLLFLGVLNYYPNRDAVEWFCREVIPRLRDVDGWRFVVGGYRMSKQLNELLKSIPEVDRIGSFATAVEGFSHGDALVVPIRSGAGTRIKILEAFQHGKPVISTAVGIEGIEAIPDRDFLLAETPEDFVHQISRLINEPKLRSSLARHGRDLVHKHYSLQVAEEAVKREHI